jgi:hypothetical protein
MLANDRAADAWTQRAQCVFADWTTGILSAFSAAVISIASTRARFEPRPRTPISLSGTLQRVLLTP